MNQFISEKLQTRVQSVRKNPRYQVCKMLYLVSFGLGFIMVLMLGKNFLSKTELLGVEALIEVRNASLDREKFLKYIFGQRFLIFSAGVILWWWNLGRLYVYGILAWTGFSMGICMYTCLLRYALKGFFLWFFLYFPHALFYAGVIICGMILSSEVHRDRMNKIKFLWQNGLWGILLLVLCAIGIYTEGTWNAAMLQDFLQYF